MTPRLPRGVRLRHDRVRSRWVLLAPERIFEVDDIGVAILQRCDGRSLDQMLEDLSKTFEAPIEAIRGDVVSFLKGFAEKRVLEL
ncbi:MAG: pyrroloquinoline quinone biosynthesis peptide chaperone PqqD [Rhizobiales bacterium]|nr:pyrroloquinoline quinone biosynthesis peptide chaperone PqqD [Hyphomicrobiales bacterium]